MNQSNSESYETMNADDQIKEQTRLFGLIAEKAGSNRVFVELNRRLKEDGVDAMMIPMNIRTDDFYFTLSNMKRSHVNGAYIAQEYQVEALEVIDERDEFVDVYGKCDFVIRDGERLIGTFIGRGDQNDEAAIAEAIYLTYITKNQ